MWSVNSYCCSVSDQRVSDSGCNTSESTYDSGGFGGVKEEGKEQESLLNLLCGASAWMHVFGCSR